MVAKKTKKRLPKAIRTAEKLRRQAARRRPLGLGSGPGYPDLPPPWDDMDGGAGVREPRSPRTPQPAGAIALEPPRSQYLDLVL
jgi:hypothetical protein